MENEKKVINKYEENAQKDDNSINKSDENS